MSSQSNQLLFTLPPAMAEAFQELEGGRIPNSFAVADPPAASLGSGGATAHLLAAAWRATNPGTSFADWLQSSRKLLLHGGGQSRRLPAYAVTGKPLLPLPALRWSRGQRLDQTLLDFQVPEFLSLLESAPPGLRVMVTSGDVAVLPGRPLPAIPEADVVGFGVSLPPEVARHFGVFFLRRGQTDRPAFFLQKPAADQIRESTGEYHPLADSGIWLFSVRALEVLLRRTGWNETVAQAGQWTSRHYEIYAGFGLALGDEPTECDPEISALRCAVVRLREHSFFHLGTSRQMIEAVSQLHRAGEQLGQRGVPISWDHPHQHLQNCRFGLPLRREANRTLWIENAVVPDTWVIAHDHVLTNIPDNRWDLRLESGNCLDCVPVGKSGVAVRFYGLDDAFRGRLDDPGTILLGRAFESWLAARGLSFQASGLDPALDVQVAPLFPVLEPDELDARFLEWLLHAAPPASDMFRGRWLRARRLSADALMREANVRRLYLERESQRRACVLPMMQSARRSIFHRLDLAATAELVSRGTASGDSWTIQGGAVDPMQALREDVFRAAVLRAQGATNWAQVEARAFSRLRDLIENGARLAAVSPRCTVQEDQIVWGRSPVRLDLAGGWTDTPPYCLENGGRVVNVAVNLNGQAPLQVFARVASAPELVIRSIDLGVEQRVRTYEELDTFAQPGSEFALAKAALALSGFLPRFHAGGGLPSLRQQLLEFGGGIEISLLSAVPKGSGLGTSSILAATLLATIGDLCGLGWDRQVLFARTLALEQMLTTGGGWQDQAGGLFQGIKMIETAAGLEQRPVFRWLPEQLFEPAYANEVVLLYYTGITRMAKGILHEVVRGVFLNNPAHLATLEEIGANALLAFNALQEADYGSLAEAVGRSWALNQRLDAGTNPPAVQAILAAVEHELAGWKLLGAGGGGYLLMMAKDREAAVRVRSRLTRQPPNPKARFVQFSVSRTGLELTRS